MTTPVSIVKSDKIWFKDFYVLFKFNRITEFFPNKLQTQEERMNSLARLSIYSGLLLTAYKRDYRQLIWTLLGLIMTYFIYKNYYKENMESDTPQKFIKKKKEIKPTLNNPFMNTNLTDYVLNPDKDSAPTYFEDTEPAQKIREAVNEKFNYNLYKSIDDVYDKNNSQRNFYTTPNTQIPSDQDKYLNFLYGDMKTNCKSDTAVCEPYSELRANPFIFPNQNDNPTVSGEALKVLPKDT